MVRYLDPPYMDQALVHYADDLRATEVNHASLIADANADSDAWALSMSAPSLPYVTLALMKVEGLSFLLNTDEEHRRVARGLRERGYRWGGWFKPFAPFKANVNPGYGWEPVLFRNVAKRGRDKATIRDWLNPDPEAPAVDASTTLKKGTVGAKPPRFWYWIFGMFDMTEADTFEDHFPGSGGGAARWAEWCSWTPEQREDVLKQILATTRTPKPRKVAAEAQEGALA